MNAVKSVKENEQRPLTETGLTVRSLLVITLPLSVLSRNKAARARPTRRGMEPRGHRAGAAGVVAAMRAKSRLLALALAGFSPGCALVQDGVHNVCTEVRDAVDDVRERARNRAWAES